MSLSYTESIRSRVETEIKLAVSDATTASKQIRAAGFRLSRARRFESNVVYDSDSGLLRRQGQLLRIRQCGSETLLTFKGRGKRSRHKTREELELAIGDAELMDQILDRLGLRPVFRYEKYRTEYRDADGTGLVTLDETPIGVFIEVEGQPDWIDHTATALGRTGKDYITASYGELYRDFCRRKRVRPGNMVFPGGSWPTGVGST